MTTFLIAIVAIALFMVGLSITLMRRGRNLQGDVGENDDMKRLGLECTSQTIRREEAALRGEEYVPLSGCATGSCASCKEHSEQPCGQ